MSRFKQSSIDWPTVLKTLAGGATLGAGIGTGTSLLRYLHTLSQKAKPETPLKDDILYLDLPAQKQASRDANNAATFATSALAGIGGTYGAYNVVRDLYSKIRKKQLEKEIARAQEVYIGNLGSQSKEASGQFSGITKGVGSVYLGALLSILGSGIVTNKILQKKFPDVESPERNRLKKVVIRTLPSEGAPGEEMSSDGTEGLLRQNLGNAKVARASGLGDLVSAVAAGRGPELKELLADCGDVNVIFDVSKGSSRVKTSSLNRNLAITWLVTDPLISEPLKPIIAAEYYDWVPHCKVASYIDPMWHSDLVALAEYTTQATRRSVYTPLLKHLDLTKSATSVLSNPIASKFIVADALNRMILGNQDQAVASKDEAGEQQSTSADDSVDSQDAQSPAGLPSHAPSFEVDDQEASNFLHNNKDILDQVLTQA